MEFFETPAFGAGDTVRLSLGSEVVEGVFTGKVELEDGYGWNVELRTGTATYRQVGLDSIDKIEAGE